MIEQTHSLANHFLIAMPALSDPHFAKTVTYICQHGPEGALGIIVNRPSELKVGDIMEQMNISIANAALASMPIYFGGPVQPERGFVLHEPMGRWDSTLEVSSRLSLTTSKDILEAIARDEGPRKILIALGYAGWGSGQLEKEIVENSWLNAPAETSIIFEHPSAKIGRAHV